MESATETLLESGVPEFTELGKRIEFLRIDRGISKQHLARGAETSRQQLWRVMTGKSELTLGLKSRLAGVLKVPIGDLEPGAGLTRTTTLPTTALRVSPNLPIDMNAYLGSGPAIARTLATMPSGDSGRMLKRRFLDAIEDLALADGRTLDRHFFDLRRRVLAAQL
jgi:transcriptional regulator with XRE-family HTH domain